MLFAAVHESACGAQLGSGVSNRELPLIGVEQTSYQDGRVGTVGLQSRHSVVSLPFAFDAIQ